MAIAVEGPSVVGRDDDQPVLIELFLAVFHGVPDLLDLLTRLQDETVQIGSVAVTVSGVIRVPEIDPAQVRGVPTDAGSGFRGDSFIIVEDVQVFFLVGEPVFVPVVSVVHVVYLQPVGFGFPFTQQDRTVVRPTRIDGGPDRFFLRLGNPEQAPVVIVRGHV